MRALIEKMNEVGRGAKITAEQALTLSEMERSQRKRAGHQTYTWSSLYNMNTLRSLERRGLVAFGATDDAVQITDAGREWLKNNPR